MKASLVLLLSIPLLASACKKKEDGAKAGATAEPADKPAAEPADKPAAEPTEQPEALAADTEIDLSPWGEPFVGYVLTAPAGSVPEFDDPSRQLKITDTDFLSVGEAPGYDEAMKGLASDKDNSNIQKISDTEVRWERNPPLGKEWNFDIKLTAVKDWDCSGSTFTSAAMADKLVAICKSIRKK